MACIATRLKAAATTLALACALACAFGASGTQRAAAQSAVARCAGLDNFAQLAALSEHLFSDPVGNFSRSGLQQMLALTTTVERRTLQSRLTSRFRSLEYNDIKATLAHGQAFARQGGAAGTGHQAQHARHEFCAHPSGRSAIGADR